MNPFEKTGWNDFISILLIVSLVLSTSGCAAMFRGTSQTCRVVTNPPGKTIVYNGMKISDGEFITIQKHFEPTRVNASNTNSHVLVELHYDPDPLLICDAALLLLYVVPGLVALGVDFGTGAWRNHHNPQVIYLPEFVSDTPHQEPIVVANATETQESSPPPWAPAHGYRAKYKYRYYSLAAVYYDIERRLYFYHNDGQWVVSAAIPSEIRIDINNYVILGMNTDKPYEFHTEIVKRYPPG